jgi:hypothetical protein
LVAGTRTLGRWSNQRWDADRRDIWLLVEDDGSWTVKIGAGPVDQAQYTASWNYPSEAQARARVEHCIATGGDGWSEIPEGSGPGGVGWYLGTTT